MTEIRVPFLRRLKWSLLGCDLAIERIGTGSSESLVFWIRLLNGFAATLFESIPGFASAVQRDDYKDSLQGKVFGVTSSDVSNYPFGYSLQLPV